MGGGAGGIPPSNFEMEKKWETGTNKRGNREKENRDTRDRKARMAVGPEYQMKRRQENLKGRRSMIFR